MDPATIVSVLFTVAAIVFIFFLSWLVTRLVGARSGATSRGAHIRVIEKAALSKDCSIALVEACGRLMLVGVSPQGITTLRELEPGEMEIPPAPEPAGSFAEALRAAFDDALPDGLVRRTAEKVLHGSNKLMHIAADRMPHAFNAPVQTTPEETQTGPEKAARKAAGRPRSTPDVPVQTTPEEAQPGPEKAARKAAGRPRSTPDAPVQATPEEAQPGPEKAARKAAGRPRRKKDGPHDET